MLLRRLALLALMLLLGGCGFHLRGAQPLPELMAKIQLVAPAGSDLRYELAALLHSAGAEVVEQPGDASAIVTVLSDEVRSRILSIDPQGRAQEYVLTLSVKYSVKALADESPAQALSSRVERDLRVDPDNVLGRGAEQEVVEREMRRVAAQQILRRLRTLSLVTPAAAGGEPVPAQ